MSLFTATVVAQPHSLAERVAALEARADNTQANIELVNQVNALQTQLRELQGRLEQLEHDRQQLDGLRDRVAGLEQQLARQRTQLPEQTPPSLPQPGAAGEQAQITAQPPATPASPADAANQRRDYQHAFDFLKKGQYADASDAFLAFLAKYPEATYTPNALYWLGESYYATRNYQLAQKQFEALVSRYPSQLKTPGAMLKIGLCQLQLGDKAAARQQFAKVLESFPKSEASHLAHEQLKALQVAKPHQP